VVTLTQLRAAWLLLLLRDGDAHGYELNRVPSLGTLALDAATTYRTLRAMDADGLIDSRWSPSRNGPRRRVYTITPAGREALLRIEAEVEAARDVHDAFLEVCRQPGRPALLR
jgi:DNA-binding PadR family transcriptional regulator